ncbi:phytoene desaturase family protein, partial [Vicingaceae bacterium]|nr:phytoene desaturase family protein [Vicingaceae bacterium]
IAGIAAALRLKKKGYKVDIYESNSYTGGKLHALKSSGFRWDAGPSLFTMPHLVDEVIELFSNDPKSYFQYIEKENICNYFWEDGTRFKVSKDLDQFINEASNKFNEEPLKIKNYLKKAKLKYDLTKELFLERSLHKVSTYLRIKTLITAIQFFRLDLFLSLDKTNKKAFKSEKLIQLFNRYATYNGSSPYETPGIMSMIPHLEMYFGTFFPKGGMHEISQSLTRLASDQGIEIHLNNSVNRILHKNGEVVGIETEIGEKKADLIVCNMDVFSAYTKLIKDIKPPEKVLKQERSSSALIFYWGIKGSFPELDLHNIFFSDSYKEEFEEIFETKGIHEDPTVYINITSKEAPEDAPEEHENWFVMVNAPANYGQDWEDLKQKAKKNIIKKLNRILKIDLNDLIEVEEILEPLTIESRTSSYRGSLYGNSSNNKFAAFLRHSNFSSQINNLYFCGGSVHPGGGIPLCLLSAKIVSNLVPKP